MSILVFPNHCKRIAESTECENVVMRWRMTESLDDAFYTAVGPMSMDCKETWQRN